MLRWIRRQLRIRQLRKGIARGKRFLELVDALENELGPLPQARASANRIRSTMVFAQLELDSLLVSLCVE